VGAVWLLERVQVRVVGVGAFRLGPVAARQVVVRAEVVVDVEVVVGVEEAAAAVDVVVEEVRGKGVLIKMVPFLSGYDL
jgi:hypothetical protein